MLQAPSTRETLNAGVTTLRLRMRAVFQEMESMIAERVRRLTEQDELACRLEAAEGELQRHAQIAMTLAQETHKREEEARVARHVEEQAAMLDEVRARRRQEWMGASATAPAESHTTAAEQPEEVSVDAPALATEQSTGAPAAKPNVPEAECSRGRRSSSANVASTALSVSLVSRVGLRCSNSNSSCISSSPPMLLRKSRQPHRRRHRACQASSELMRRCACEAGTSRSHKAGWANTAPSIFSGYATCAGQRS